MYATYVTYLKTYIRPPKNLKSFSCMMQSLPLFRIYFSLDISRQLVHNWSRFHKSAFKTIKIIGNF